MSILDSELRLFITHLLVGVVGLEPTIHADYSVYSTAPNQFGITAHYPIVDSNH